MAARPRAVLEAVVRALLYLLRTGCPWRDVPCTMIHWRTVYGYFAHWRDTGLWTQIFGRLVKRACGRLHFIDASYVRVHQSAANVRGAQALAAVGKSRGGLTDKGCDSDKLRALLVEDDIFPCLALNATRREKRPFHRGYYRHRHYVENFL